MTRALINNSVPLGQYVNPDDIAKHISFGESVDLVKAQLPENTTKLPQSYEISDEVFQYIEALMAQKIAIGLRHDWIDANLSLTYESVMSHPSHLDFVETAADAGFQPYLYYICTSDPRINQERVRQRVDSGGHDVPSDKIVSRYHNSLSLLYDMVMKCREPTFLIIPAGPIAISPR
ncbi:MAG: hypothetical protein L0Y53_13855 [Chromohalobacter sp.]|nr:hypothetical protein [Chromohalobacter sp.]